MPTGLAGSTGSCEVLDEDVDDEDDEDPTINLKRSKQNQCVSSPGGGWTHLISTLPALT